MKLLILAGGYGTRLRSVVSKVPKALAPVGSVPFLKLQLRKWLDQGVTHFVFLLHHQAEQIIDFLKTEHVGQLRGCQIDYVIEPQLMGTGGAIAYAVNTLDLNGTFLLTNADTWLGGGVREVSRSDSSAMAVVHLPDVRRYGQVHFDQGNYVNSFSEKNNSKCTPGWINAGLCCLSAELFKGWDGQAYSLERDLFPTLVSNKSLKAIPLNTEFLDIGIPVDYQRFCRWVESGRSLIL